MSWGKRKDPSPDVLRADVPPPRTDCRRALLDQVDRQLRELENNPRWR